MASWKHRGEISLADVVAEVVGIDAFDEMEENHPDWEDELIGDSFCLLSWTAGDQYSTRAKHFSLSLDVGDTVVCVHEDGGGARVIEYFVGGASPSDYLKVLAEYYREWFDDDGIFTSDIVDAYTDLEVVSPMVAAILSKNPGPHPVFEESFWRMR